MNLRFGLLVFLSPGYINMVEKQKHHGRREEGPAPPYRLRPLDVDEFGSIVPLREPLEEPVEPVDELGHVGLTSRIEFSPTKRKREIGKLTQLFKK